MKKYDVNITWDLDGLVGFESYSDGRTREQVLNTLPITVTIEVNNDETVGDVVSELFQTLESDYGWLVPEVEINIDGLTKTIVNYSSQRDYLDAIFREIQQETGRDMREAFAGGRHAV